MTKVDNLETYILDGKEYLSTYSIRKLLAKVEHLGFTKYACEEVLKRFRMQTDTQTDQTPNKNTKSKKKNDTETRGSTTPPPPIHDNIEKLSSEDLEKRIISALNIQPNNAQLLGKAIEFFIKIKGKVETIDESFNMEELMRLGLITDVSK